MHGVVRWWLSDLAEWVMERYGASISEQTLSRYLRAMGYRRLSARPLHHAQNPDAVVKRMARPVGKMNLKMVLKVCANVSGLTSDARNQDGDPRALVLIKGSASKHRFLNQAIRTPVDR